MPLDPDLLSRVETWIAGDPDPATRTELARLVDAGDASELEDRFEARLAFGTAGIRGEVGAGPNRINRAVAIQTAAGLAAHLLAEGGAPGVVVVGHDARPSSPALADDVVGVLAAAGFDVLAFDRPIPTPIVAHAALAHDAAAAVVVTASHNPPQDNGIKVYAGNGIQIVPPTDVSIARRIDAVGPASEVPLRNGGIREVATVLGDDAVAAYVRDVVAHRAFAEDGRPAGPLTIVATPLHGVGGGPLLELFAAAGHRVELVPRQAEPDGSFPTVGFPNPEEPGALDLLLDLARERDADLALANDPDADRLAVAIADRAGGHRVLTGNEVGVVLADALLQAGDRTIPRVVASSVVSSPQLGAVADQHGARHEVTLTGFKWIWNALLACQQDGWTPVLGYEEALGYSIGDVVRDKDGLSAALAVADLAARERARGRTLDDRLDDLARETGVWTSLQRSAVVDEAALVAVAFERLRTSPPSDLAGLDVAAVIDHVVPDDRRPPWLGTQNLLEYRLLDRGTPVGRALIRPSGTEPKVKVYVDLTAPAAPGDRPRAGAGELEDRAGRVASSLLALSGLA